MRKYSIFIFMATLMLLSCKNANTNNINTNKILKEAANSEGMNVGSFAFDFDLPNDWYRIDTVYQGVQVCLLTTNDAVFQPKINVTNESMQGLPHDKYVTSAIQFMLNNSNKVEILEKGQFLVRDKNCIWVSYKIEQNGIKRELVFYSIANKGISYNITSAIKSGGLKKYKNTFDDIVTTFRLN